MKKTIPFDLADGQVYIEVEDEDQSPVGFQRAGRGVDVGGSDAGKKRFTDAIAAVKPAAEALLNSLKEMNTPSEIGLNFGLKFNAKVGAVFTSADSEANFKISLKWTNKPSE